MKAKLHAWGLVAIGALLLVGAGCTSTSRAREQARLAYLAGQRDAIAQMSQKPAESAAVTFIGPVTNPMVPWAQGLTLTRAILAAEYHSPLDPMMILVRRAREEIQIDPGRLLNGFDIPLLPGDIVQFQLPVQ